jgi:hypothetical protein
MDLKPYRNQFKPTLPRLQKEAHDTKSFGSFLHTDVTKVCLIIWVHAINNIWTHHQSLMVITLSKTLG